MSDLEGRRAVPDPTPTPVSAGDLDRRPSTLGDFVATREFAVLYYCVGHSPEGDYVPVGGGHRFAGERTWRKLNGIVDRFDRWLWDGEPPSRMSLVATPTPRDPWSPAWSRWKPGVVWLISAHRDERRWRELVPNWDVLRD